MLFSPYLLAFTVLSVHFSTLPATPITSTSWADLPSTDGIKFSGRNAHASCVFKKKIWVTGGRTNAYTMYNLLESFKVADVWKSSDGGKPRCPVLPLCPHPMPPAPLQRSGSKSPS